MSDRSRLRASQSSMPKPSPTEPLPPLLSSQTSMSNLGGSDGGGIRPGSRASEPGQKLQDMETIVMVKQYALDAVKKAVARFMDPKVQAMEALLQSAKEVADNESPDKKGPIKISTQGNEGKEESQLHQLRWKMQDAQSQIKELTRRMEEMAGGGGGRGGGGGGSPSVLNTDGLSNALASGSVEQLGGVIQELQQQIATIKKHVKQLIVDRNKQKEDDLNFQAKTEGLIEAHQTELQTLRWKLQEAQKEIRLSGTTAGMNKAAVSSMGPGPALGSDQKWSWQVEIANFQAKVMEEKAAWQKEQEAQREASLNEMREMLREELSLASTDAAVARLEATEAQMAKLQAKMQIELEKVAARSLELDEMERRLTESETRLRDDVGREMRQMRTTISSSLSNQSMADEREMKRLKEAEEKLNVLLAAAASGSATVAESPSKSGPIKISTDENEGKDEALLHQLRWKMQDTQSQLKELSRKVEDKIEGKGKGGGGGGSDSANELAALTAKMYEEVMVLHKVQEENVDRKIKESSIKLREELTGRKGGMSGGGIALPGSGDSEAVNAANAARDARLMATEARMGDLAHELKEERGRHFDAEIKIRNELESGLNDIKDEMSRLKSEVEATYQSSTRQEREAQKLEGELRSIEGHLSELQVAQEGARETQLKDSAVIKELSSRIDSLKGDVREEVGKVHMTVGVAEAAALRAERAVNSAGTQGTDSASAAHGTREAQLRREADVVSRPDSGFTVTTDGNEGKEEALLHQLRWKMQTTQTALKDLSTKIQHIQEGGVKSSGGPGGGGNGGFDALSEMAVLASKMVEDQMSSQKLIREQLEKKVNDLKAEVNEKLSVALQAPGPEGRMSSEMSMISTASPDALTRKQLEDLVKHILPPQLIDKIARLQSGAQGPMGLPGWEGNDGMSGADGRDGRDGKKGERGETGLKGADGASVHQVEQLVKTMTRKQLEEMLSEVPKPKYDQAVKELSGLAMSSDGNESKEENQLHQLRWKMQDTQSQLKDLATKLKDSSKPASGSSWDGLGELAMLTSKMHEDQVAFQRLMEKKLQESIIDLRDEIKRLEIPQDSIDVNWAPSGILATAPPPDQLSRRQIEDLIKFLMPPELLDKLAMLDGPVGYYRGLDGSDGIVYHTEGAAGKDGKKGARGEAGLKGADGASVHQVEQLVKTLTRKQLEEMLDDIPKPKYEQAVKAVSGLVMTTDGNESKEEAQLHQLRWKMQDTQSQLKDLATKVKESSKNPPSNGSSWDGLGELAVLASKMSQEQAAFQKATRDLISKRFQENEEQIKALKWDVAPSKILAHAATEPSQLLHELPREQLEQVLLDSDDIAARLKALNALPVELVDLGDGLDRGFSGFPGLRKEKSEGARERRANLEERLKNLPHVQMMNDMMKALGKFKVDNVETIIHSGMTPEEVHEAINRAMSSDGGAGGGSSTVRPKSGTLTMAALEEKLRGMTEKQLQDIIANIPRETTIDKIESLPQDQIDKFITRAMLQDALGSLNRNQLESLFSSSSMTPEQFEDKMRLLRQLTEGQARLKEGLRGEQGHEGRAGADGTRGSTLSLNYNGLAGSEGLDSNTKSLLEANAAAAAALASFSDAQRKEVWALVGSISNRLAELEGIIEGGGGSGKRSLLTQESNVMGRRIGTLEQEIQLLKSRTEGSGSARLGVGAGSVEEIARASQSANQALGSSNRAIADSSKALSEVQQMKSEHDDFASQMRSSLAKMAEIQMGYEAIKPDIDRFNLLAKNGGLGVGGGGGGDTSLLQRELERLQQSHSAFVSKVDLLSTELVEVKGRLEAMEEDQVPSRGEGGGNMLLRNITRLQQGRGLEGEDSSVGGGGGGLTVALRVAGMEKEVNAVKANVAKQNESFMMLRQEQEQLMVSMAEVQQLTHHLKHTLNKAVVDAGNALEASDQATNKVSVLASNMASIDNSIATQEAACLRMGSDLLAVRDQVGQVKILSEQVADARKATNELGTKCDNLYRVVDNMKEDVEDALKAATRNKANSGGGALTGDQEGRVQGMENDIAALQRAIQQLNKMGNSSNQTSSLSTTTVTLFDLKEIENELLRRISDIGQEMEVIRKHINDELGVKLNFVVEAAATSLQNEPSSYAPALGPEKSVNRPALGNEKSRAGNMVRELKNMASMLPRGGLSSISTAQGGDDGDLDTPPDHGRPLVVQPSRGRMLQSQASRAVAAHDRENLLVRTSVNSEGGLSDARPSPVAVPSNPYSPGDSIGGERINPYPPGSRSLVPSPTTLKSSLRNSDAGARLNPTNSVPLPNPFGGSNGGGGLSEESSLPYMGPVGSGPSPLGVGASGNRSLMPQPSTVTGRTRFSMGGAEGAGGGTGGGAGGGESEGGGGGDLRARLLQARKSKVVREE